MHLHVDQWGVPTFYCIYSACSLYGDVFTMEIHRESLRLKVFCVIEIVLLRIEFESCSTSCQLMNTHRREIHG